MQVRFPGAWNGRMGTAFEGPSVQLLRLGSQFPNTRPECLRRVIGKRPDLKRIATKTGSGLLLYDDAFSLVPATGLGSGPG